MVEKICLDRSQCSRRIGKLGAVVALTACAATLHAPARAQDFFQNKTIRIIVGFPPGGGFDMYARLLAQVLPKHIPGAPRVVVENMPGATTARAAAYIYGVGPQDGTVMGILHQGLLANQVLGLNRAEFDVVKFNWIGRMGTQLNVGVAWHSSKMKTIEEARQRPIAFGATSPTATSVLVPRAVNHAFGTKISIVTGYQGSADMVLAMERGEIEGMATFVWADLIGDRANWVANGTIAPLFQIALRPHKDLPHVPVLAALARNDDDRTLLELFAGTEDMGRAFLVGPGVPPERVALLRSAFAKVMADPESLQEGAKRNLELDYMHGDELQALVSKTGSFPSALRQKAKNILMPSGG